METCFLFWKATVFFNPLSAPPINFSNENHFPLSGYCINLSKEKSRVDLVIEYLHDFCTLFQPTEKHDMPGRKLWQSPIEIQQQDRHQLVLSQMTCYYSLKHLQYRSSSGPDFSHGSPWNKNYVYKTKSSGANGVLLLKILFYFNLILDFPCIMLNKKCIFFFLGYFIPFTILVLIFIFLQ